MIRFEINIEDINSGGKETKVEDNEMFQMSNVKVNMNTLVMVDERFQPTTGEEALGNILFKKIQEVITSTIKEINESTVSIEEIDKESGEQIDNSKIN